VRRVAVTVHPRSTARRVEERDGVLHAWVTKAPAGGQANAELLRLMARHLGVPLGSLRIAAGASSRRKLLEID
jgi:uncharacterized protein